MRAAALGACLLAGLAAGCGGSHPSAGSIPITTVPKPSGKVLFRVPSSSMEPTFHCARPAPGCEAAQDDRVVVREPAGDIARGDVLAFRTPPQARISCGAGGIFLKRVIGLGGETVKEQNGIFSINGKPLDEPYINPNRRDHEPARTWHVPAGAYFLVGDNRELSCDSRAWGSAPAANIIGKVVQILRPG